MNYKKTSKIFLVAFLGLTIIFPSFSFAVTETPASQRDAKRAEMEARRDAKKEEIQGQKAEKTCEMISKQAEQIQSRLTERISKLTQKRTETEAKIQERVAQRTTQRTQRRETWEDTKETNWEKLQSKAETDEQKEAVATFTKAMQTAVKIKNDAIDKVISELRATIQTRHNERKSEVDAQIAKYKDAVATITNQVKADCANGKDAKEIREYYRTEMKKAREEFQANKKAVDKLKDEITPLKEAKKNEIKAIIETFKSSVEKAKTDLRSAFPTANETE